MTKTTDPKILTLDIETSPGEAYVWALYGNDYIPLERLITPSRVMMIGYKWYGKPKVHIYDERRHGAEMFVQINSALQEADAVITYNGDKFDLPRLHGHMVEYNLPPLPPVTSIDLIKPVKKLGLQSNKLEYVAKYFGIGAKVKHHGFELWAECMEGKPSAWKKMREYNKGDVLLTEALYSKMRPYIKTHPYLRNPREQWDCPNCGTENARHQHRGTYRTRASITERIQCLECGAWSKGKMRRVTRGSN